MPRACVCVCARGACLAIARGASRVRGTSVVSPRTTRARSIELPAGTAGRLAGEGVGGSEILLLPWQVLADGSGKSGAWTVAPVRAPGSAGRSSQEPAADAWSRVTSLRRTCMHHQRRPQARSSVSCMPYGCWSSLSYSYMHAGGCACACACAVPAQRSAVPAASLRASRMGKLVRGFQPWAIGLPLRSRSSS